MPEGPEVKKMAIKLSKLITNKQLIKINILSGRYKIHDPPKHYDLMKQSLPTKVLKVSTKGKFIYVWFKNNYYLWNTLGMTGQWTKIKHKHSHIEFVFKNKKIYFTDMRNFGTIRFSFDPKSLQDKLTIIGPDVLELDTNQNHLFSRLLKIKTKKPIAEVLLNQCIISGIGNYLRADILWYAKLSPYRTISSLTKTELKRLYEAIIEIVWFYYDFNRGVKLKKIKNIKFFEKYYYIDFFVYQQDKDIYGNKIIREKINTRTIHWCPDYQK